MELHQRLLLILAFCAQAAAAASPPGFQQLARLSASGARVTAAVWDLDADQSIAELGAAQRLTPASLSKIVIAAAALDTWAPDYSFATELRSAVAPGDRLTMRCAGPARG